MLQGGAQAPPEDRPRRWQYALAAIVIVALAVLLYWLRARG